MDNKKEKKYLYENKLQDHADITFLVRGFVMFNHLNDTKDIIEKIPDFPFDFTQLALSACKNGHMDIVKYFFENYKEKINLYEPYSTGQYYTPDGFLLTPFFENKLDVVHYILYDLQFDVARDTKNYLQFHHEEELMHLVEKRDLFFKLDNDEKVLSNNSHKKTSIKL